MNLRCLAVSGVRAIVGVSTVEQKEKPMIKRLYENDPLAFSLVSLPVIVIVAGVFVFLAEKL